MPAPFRKGKIVRITLRSAGVGLGVGLLLTLLAGSVAGQGDSALLRAFSRFLGTQDIQFDLVPDLYDGGYARISIFAKNANLGGMLVDERSEERRVGKECRSRWSPYH